MTEVNDRFISRFHAMGIFREKFFIKTAECMKLETSHQVVIGIGFPYGVKRGFDKAVS